MLSVWQGVLLLLGGAFILTAGIGILRLPDALCRSHALSKALTLGVSFILIVLLTTISTLAASVKVLLVIALNFTTIPLAAHIFALYASRD